MPVERWLYFIISEFWYPYIDGDTIVNEVYYCCETGRLTNDFVELTIKQHETVCTVCHNQTISL